MLILVFLRAQMVANRVVGLDRQVGIIAPGFRIAHAHMGGGDLGLGLCLGGWRHPGQFVHAAVERCQDIADHLLHFGLGRRGKVLLDVELADRVAEIMIHRAERALPAIALRWRALQGMAVELEAGVGIRLGQQAGDMVDGVEGEIGLPGIQRHAGDQCRFGSDGGGLPDHDLLLGVEPGGLEIGRPVQARRLAGEVGQRPGIVRLVHVLAIDQAFLRLRDPGFQIEHGFGLFVGIGDAGVFQLGGDIALVLGAKGRHVLVGIEVVVAVRHAQAALQQIRHAA